MHVLPQVRELEHRFERELVVIGVHCGKFRAERDTENIAQAVDRLDVRHPVVNDRQYRVWRAFGVNAWPTVVLLDAEGGIVGVQPGEFDAGDLAPAIERLVAEADERGVLDRRPHPVAAPPEHESVLRYPGKLLALAGGRLFVADTGHHRILDLQVEVNGLRQGRAEGRVARLRRVVGSGERGHEDGALAEARFSHPGGMEFALRTGHETLYVADTENHSVRAVDLSLGVVETLAGSGRQARRFDRPGAGREIALSSPWDLAAVGSALLVAMAGTHQLWRIETTTGNVDLWAGTGREDISDGPASRATLAQPTGLSLDGQRLYVADSESSAVRFAEPADDPRRSPQVSTLVGRGLFEFGDEDGQGGHARLQHPYGVAAHGGTVYVADTYNNKIKALDVSTRRITTFLGSGEGGLRDGEAGEAAFDEPQGIAVADEVLYVADTNNHALRAADLRSTPPRVVTLSILDTTSTVAARLGIRCGP